MMYFYYQADHRISDSEEDVVLRQIPESPHPYAILALRIPQEELPLPSLSWGHPYPTAPAGAQMRFPLLRPSAAFMPSAMVKLMFPVAGTAFLCGGRAKSYLRVLICKVSLQDASSSHRSLGAVHPSLWDCGAGTLGWRQQVQVPFLLSLLSCLTLDIAWPRISVSFFVLLSETVSYQCPVPYWTVVQLLAQQEMSM